ncbi:MAG: 6-carboxytetrahydropterin synthase [Planctomycetaceae bacterium]|jgi:6-pyruvoyltetrahydropterin/6-carboxytetrahydropterin synthase|nr:6-carboxytetrahydropterin synthase [Planctomycetaceae bacterium]
MFTVSRDFSFCYAHRLLDYDGKCSHLHGHNAKVKVTLRSSELMDGGMLLDFNKMKRTIGVWIDENLDHRVILCKKDPLVELLLQINEPVYLLPDNPTAENLAKLIFGHCEKLNLPVVSVQLQETENCRAEFTNGNPQ